MKARRPYLLRAIHEWISDSLCTPHLVVDANAAGVEVPRQYVKDGKIVLNVSWSATANLRLGNEEVSFSGRFGGASMSVRVPIIAVLPATIRDRSQRRRPTVGARGSRSSNSCGCQARSPGFRLARVEACDEALAGACGSGRGRQRSSNSLSCSVKARSASSTYSRKRTPAAVSGWPLSWTIPYRVAR
jgi:stringent starvation protein B